MNYVLWSLHDLNFMMSKRKTSRDFPFRCVQLKVILSLCLSKKVSQTHSKNKISALQGLRLGSVQVFTHPSFGLYIASSIVFSKITRSPGSALPFWTVHLLASDVVLTVIFLLCHTAQCDDESIIAWLCPNSTTSFCTVNASHKHSRSFWFYFLPLL